MPLYEYQCECGLRFEATAKMGDHTKPQPCPDCQKLAARCMPDDMSGVFHQEVSGPTPQNTGIDSLDGHIDRVIGQSAETGRKAHSVRVEAKKELLRDNPGATGYDITQDDKTGEFHLMSEDERRARDAALGINNQAMNAIQQERRRAASPEVSNQAAGGRG